MELPVGWLLSQKPAPPGCLAAGWLLGVVQTFDEIIQNNVLMPGRSVRQQSCMSCFRLLGKAQESVFHVWNGENPQDDHLNRERGCKLSLMLLHPVFTFISFLISFFYGDENTHNIYSYPSFSKIRIQYPLSGILLFSFNSIFYSCPQIRSLLFLLLLLHLHRLFLLFISIASSFVFISPPPPFFVFLLI
uniref:Uncharacterized protein n=1 Tax=Molossus molossus TaxID=27622 RepID=A0A7J8C8Y0_MOLMO|nr:hypothetical protein HJG59_009921 [Molossus molossus]